MCGSRAFECNVEPQLKSEDVFKSEIVRAYIFDSFFSVPEAGKGPPFSVYIGCFMAIKALFVKTTSWKQRKIMYN